MIKFYGDFRLVNVTKVAKTKKNESLVVYFTAATHRSKKISDFKLFKTYGKNAERLLDNLEKKDEGKYKSRYMLIEGYVETFKESVSVECSTRLEPDDVPENLGKLKKGFKIKAYEKVELDRDVYVVNNFIFLDSSKTNKTKRVISNDDDDDEGTVVIGEKPSGSRKYSSNKNTEAAATTNEKRKTARDNVKSKSKSAYNDLEDVENNISSLKSEELSSIASNMFKNIRNIDEFVGNNDNYEDYSEYDTEEDDE